MTSLIGFDMVFTDVEPTLKQNLNEQCAINLPCVYGIIELLLKKLLNGKNVDEELLSAYFITIYYFIMY